MPKIMLKDIKRIGSYGEIIKVSEWKYVDINSKGYFKVGEELYSKEDGEVIYNPSDKDFVEVVKNIIKYFGDYITSKESVL